ncbi:MAG: haloacid dehalogenase [Pedobacter sp.]
MAFEKFLTDKKAVAIVLDDALYPQKDYLLQVYYLFSEFMAYSEQINAKAIIDFMSNEYEKEGSSDIFAKTAAKFSIPEKYQHNFDLLHETARLPLKLLLFQKVLDLLQEAVVDRKQIFILAQGKPTMAINKIKQLEWHGLEQYLKLYFLEEYENSIDLTIRKLLDEQGLEKDDLVLIVPKNRREFKVVNSDIKCFSVTEIL